MKRESVFAVIVVTVLVLSSTAHAKQGFYLGLGAAYNRIDGDFTGHAYLQGGNGVIIIPKIDGGFGVTAQVGYGISEQWALELDFLVSQHDGTWNSMPGDVAYASFSVNARYSFKPGEAIQPYLQFGISNNSLVIQDGSTDLSTGAVDDATLSGPGLNFGAGFDQFLSEHWRITFGILYRYVDYTDAEGINGSGSIDDSLDGSGFTTLLSTAYHF